MIRNFKIKDLKEVVRLFRKEYRKKPYNEKWSEEKANKKIKEYYKNNKIFVLEYSKVIKGFIIVSIYGWWDGKKGFIDEIVVDSDYQGNGFGKQLIKEAEKYFRKNKVSGISLMAVKKSKAFGFYKKMGYKQEDFISMVKK